MNENNKHFWIYVLELNNGKYYVGLTTQKNAEGRISQHKSGFYSSKWVKKYGYKSTMQVHDLGVSTIEEAEAVENRLTLDMMKQYGVGNVRGGRANYGGKYFHRFGYLFRDDDWEVVTSVTFLALVIVALSLAYIYEKYFI